MCDRCVTVWVFNGVGFLSVAAKAGLGRDCSTHPEVILKRMLLAAESTLRRNSADSLPAEDEETETLVSSFLVRIWRQKRPADPECRGWVEHVQSGRRTSFHQLAQLPAIIAAYAGVSLGRRGSWRQLVRAHLDAVRGRLRWQDREKEA
jgi:hypothetical protein